MNAKLFWKNRLPLFILNTLCMLSLSLFLALTGSSRDTVLLILLCWLLLLICTTAAACRQRKKELDALLQMALRLDRRCLIPEVMKPPSLAEDQVYYSLLKLAEKSMLEEIGVIDRERAEYKEYIEQWIHEIKTPITAMKLLCENNRSSFTRELLAQLERADGFARQALYYARSEHAEKDYSIHEISLCQVVHQAVADNKYLLLREHVAVRMEETDLRVFSDEKWLVFILDQLIVNAVKYRNENPTLQFSMESRCSQVLLSVSDNGMGIPPEDLPRIFEKGFTGRNGRIRQGSTGLGLYLCRRLCDKLGVGLCARSGAGQTTVVLTFQINHFVHQVQG